MLSIDKILRPVRKEFHGDKVFASNDTKLAILKWNDDSPCVCARPKPSQSQEQVNPIAKAITQRKHCTDGIIRVAMAYFSNEPGRAAVPFKFGDTMGRQRNHGIRIHAGTDYTMHGGCHRPDDSIGNPCTLEQIHCVK